MDKYLAGISIEVSKYEWCLGIGILFMIYIEVTFRRKEEANMADRGKDAE